MGGRTLFPRAGILVEEKGVKLLEEGQAEEEYSQLCWVERIRDADILSPESLLSGPSVPVWCQLLFSRWL